MRTSAFFVGALAAVATADSWPAETLTSTDEVTITSCAPEHTNCPFKATPTGTTTTAYDGETGWAYTTSTVPSTTSTTSSTATAWGTGWAYPTTYTSSATTVYTTLKSTVSAAPVQSTTYTTWAYGASSSPTVQAVSASSYAAVSGVASPTGTYGAGAYSASSVKPAIATYTGAAPATNIASLGAVAVAALAGYVMA